jgi:4-hydroxymandelate oxidase
VQPIPPSLIESLEAEAERILPPQVYDYFAGGAGEELTLRDNRDAFARVKLRPRFLRDVSTRSLETTAIGHRLSMPLAVAPMAYQRLAHPDAETGMARAAGAAGTAMTLSTMATASVEEVGAAVTGPLWLQLYVWKDRSATRALVQRALAAGASALVVTVDAPILGTRRRDELHGPGLLDGLTLGNLVGLDVPDVPKVASGSELSAHFWLLGDASLTWADLDWLRSIAGVPVVIKGILTAEDARLAVEHGADAIVVSNHGGRQLDGVVATLDALPEVVDAVAGRVEVWCDGGVRSGVDVLKALAIGARIVLVGRPLLWGLAAGGQAGVSRVLEALRTELEHGLALCGCRSPAELTRAHVALPGARRA